MKLVSFAELCLLPHGTIFQRYIPHDLGEPLVFGGKFSEDDLVEASFLPVCGMASYFNDLALNKKHNISENDLVIYMPGNFGRYAMYDADKYQYLVWEVADRERLAAWLLDSELLAAQVNDDPHSLLKV